MPAHVPSQPGAQPPPPPPCLRHALQPTTESPSHQHACLLILDALRGLLVQVEGGEWRECELPCCMLGCMGAQWRGWQGGTVWVGTDTLQREPGPPRPERHSLPDTCPAVPSERTHKLLSRMR